MSTFDCRAFMASVRQAAGEQKTAPLDWRELHHLLRLEGTAFVMHAYRRVLKREADPTGLHSYAQRARHFPGRLSILLSLLLSPEQIALPAWLRRSLSAIRRFKKG